MTGSDSLTDPLAEDVIDSLEAELDEHGLFAWLNFNFESIERGRVVFEIPFDEKFANLVSGAAHGGVTATAMDTASAFALRSTFEDPVAAQLTTTDLNVRYVRAASSDLRVEATVVRAGGTMGYTECEATTAHEGERETVATGGTSYRLFRE